MEILVLNGSPRPHGNTSAMIEAFVDGTQQSGHKAERVDGHRVQRIKIIWNCIGEFNTPVNEKSA